MEDLYNKLIINTKNARYNMKFSKNDILINIISYNLHLYEKMYESSNNGGYQCVILIFDKKCYIKDINIYDHLVEDDEVISILKSKLFPLDIRVDSITYDEDIIYYLYVSWEDH